MALEYGRVARYAFGAECFVQVVPHHDVPGDPRWHTYASAAIAKKSYDHVLAFESVPSRRWEEACESITWVPMVEFTTRSHVAELQGPSVTWHSAAGHAEGVRLRSDLTQTLAPFGLPVATAPPERRSGRPRILLHQRARSVDCEALAREVLARDPGVEVVVWDNLHRNSSVSIPGAEVVSGWLDRERWLSLAGSCDVYLASRAHEGVGLCVLEAAAAGCAIVAPAETTSGEYFPESVVSMRPLSRGASLCPEYEWPDHGEIAERLLSTCADRAVLDEARGRSWERAVSHAKGFEEFARSWAGGLSERPSRPRPKTRRRVLSIQTCRWGGQGLQELWVVREMSRDPHLAVFSCCLWTQHYDEQEEFCRLLETSSARMVDPKSLRSVEADVVVLHWSSWFEDRCAEDDLDALRSFLAETEAPVVVVAHNVDPSGWPEWLRPSVRIHPTAEARRAFRDDVPSVVLGHFLDPETRPVGRRPEGRLVVGVVGRTVWTKLDPAYVGVVSSFLRRFGAELLWLGGQSAGDVRGDWEMMSTLSPTLTSAFGPERYEVMDRMHLCLHLSGVQESYGLAAEEAASRGIPVITNRPEVYDRIKEASLLVNGPSDLERALRRLGTDPSLISRLREGGKAVAARTTSWASWRDRFWDLVTTVAAEWPGRCPAWSVVVAAKDVGPYLEECLASIVDQGPAEVVVVVDGGGDDTISTARLFEARCPEVRALHFPGPGHCQAWAWARGIEACRKRGYVAFVDGDDALLPGALARVGRAYAEDQSLSLVWTDQMVVDAAGGEIPMSFSTDPDGRTLLEAIESGENGPSHLITARYASLLLIERNEALPASADKDLCLRLEEVGSVKRIPEKLYRYRWRRPGSVTSSRPDVQAACRERVVADARRRRAGRSC